MSMRIDKSWVVLRSIETVEGDRCVDLFRRPDGSHGFEEFRRDVEDGGRWTAVAYYSAIVFATSDTAREAATKIVSWLGPRLGGTD